MRVLVFTTWFPDAAAPSTAPFNLSHVQAIAAQHEVKVIHVRLGRIGEIEVEDLNGISVTRIPFSPKHPWSFCAVVRYLNVALKQADILHTMAFTSAAVAALARIGSHKPWVHTEHWSGVNNPASVSKVWVAASWLRFILRFPNLVTAVSEAQAVGLRRFSRAGAVCVIPNVVAKSETLAPRKGSNAAWMRLVSVGSLNAGKRPEVAIETLRALRNQGHDVSLTWVGDGPLRDSVEQLIGQYGLGPYVRITGLVSPAQVTEHLRQADIFLLPTAHETFCMAAAEAVAMGLPAVVTDLPAVQDFLSEENSVLVNGETAEDYSEAVSLAMAKFSEVSSAAISRTLPDRFASHSIAEQFTQAYAFVRGGRE